MLRIVPAAPDLLEEWRGYPQRGHPDRAAELRRGGRARDPQPFTLAYDSDVLVGNATVRPPSGDAGAAAVIVRILPEHRRRGLGSAYLAHELPQARALSRGRIETVVFASNEDGLAFASARGFVEVDRYLLNGDTIPFIDLRLT